MYHRLNVAPGDATLRLMFRVVRRGRRLQQMLLLLMVVLLMASPPAVGAIVDVGGITEIIHSIGDISKSRRRGSRFDHFAGHATASVVGRTFSRITAASAVEVGMPPIIIDQRAACD